MLTKKESSKSETKTQKNPKIAIPAEPKKTHSSSAISSPPKPYSTNNEIHEHTDHCCSTDKKTNQKTRITVKHNVGYGNTLCIRGKGANLSWEKGQPLKNTKSDEWVWETETPFTQCEFKILINDQAYETGNNHSLHCGSCVIYTPHF